MNSMEIIEVTPIMQNNIPFDIFLIWAAVSIFGCIIVLLFFSWDIEKAEKICAILFASFLLSVFSYGVACAVIPDTPSGRNRYTVIIDESVNYEEIAEKYNIIESHGKIWVLEDKDD